MCSTHRFGGCVVIFCLLFYNQDSKQSGTDSTRIRISWPILGAAVFKF